MRILAIDPGVTTGYCYAEIEDRHLIYKPFQVVDDIDDMWRRLENFRPRIIIIEDFEFRRGKRAAGGLNLFPIQMIGCARLYSLMSSHQCGLVVQKASTGRGGYYTDATLKKLGLYIRGQPHAMDASRHLLEWAMFGSGNQYIGSQRTEEFAEIGESEEWPR
jgi:hypothetical protein